MYMCIAYILAVAHVMFFTQADFCTKSNYVKLALEPEVASLYCIQQMEKLLTNKTSGQHLVADCGGGTVDIAVHKWVRPLPDSELEVDEIHKVHGGSCGSFAVNAEFEQLVLDILSTGTDITLSDIKKQCGAQWNQLLYEDFENSKCSFSKEEISIFIPKPIRTYVQEKCKKSISDLIEDYKKNWDTTCNIVLSKSIYDYLKRSGKNISEIAQFYKKLKWG